LSYFIGFRDSLRILQEKGLYPKIPFCRNKKNMEKKIEQNKNDENSENDDFDYEVRLTVDQTSASRQVTKVSFVKEVEKKKRLLFYISFDFSVVS
jgi:hypothetical protein